MSTGLTHIIGQPDGITSKPFSSASFRASDEKLPWLKDRCIQTRFTLALMQSAIMEGEILGGVQIITLETVSGISLTWG